MPYSLEDKLVVAITSRALFDLDEEHRIWETRGLEAYRAHQREREDDPLDPGTGFPLVRGLLAINELAKDNLVEVVLVSRNDADSGLRIFNAIGYHKLNISRAAFTDGRNPRPYLRPFCCDLFLSASKEDVTEALGEGFPAALVYRPPAGEMDTDSSEVRIAFDGDAVLVSDEAESFFRERGLEEFQEREDSLEDMPLSPGPFKPFLDALSLIQEKFPEEKSPIRTALVTARSAPAHKRLIKTLRSWGVRLDESFFLGGVDKAGFLRAFKPHIFFDDQTPYLESAAPHTPAAQVIPLPPSLKRKGRGRRGQRA